MRAAPDLPEGESAGASVGSTGVQAQATLMVDAAEFLRALSGLVRVSMFRDRDRISAHDVTVSEAHALDILVHLGPVGLSQLAAELFVDKSTASRIVAGLEEKGYISRNIDPYDRRAIRLEVTPAGHELQDRIHAANLQDAAQLLQSFAGDVRQGMTARLQQVARTFAVYSGITDASVCRLPGDEQAIPFDAQLRVASKPDLQEALALLESVGLPTEGIRDRFLGSFVVARDPKSGQLIGVAGVESHGAVGWLRSVAVDPLYRRAGLGGTLSLAAVDLARVMGVRKLYLLTPIAEDFFLRHGWEKIGREEIPATLEAWQPHGISPATAMRARLS